jgi:hypothetical protein
MDEDNLKIAARAVRSIFDAFDRPLQSEREAVEEIVPGAYDAASKDGAARAALVGMHGGRISIADRVDAYNKGLTDSYDERGKDILRQSDELWRQVESAREDGPSGDTGAICNEAIERQVMGETLGLFGAGSGSPSSRFARELERKDDDHER